MNRRCKNCLELVRDTLDGEYNEEKLVHQIKQESKRNTVEPGLSWTEACDDGTYMECTIMTLNRIGIYESKD